MGDRSGIEWTDATWNPTTGCDQVSPGCDNCYALSMAGRLKAMGQPAYQEDGDPRSSGPGFALQVHEDRLDQPLRWTKPRRIFVNSMSDLFHPRVPDEFIAEVFGVMMAAPHHTFQVLTKRPKRMRALMNSGDFDAAVAGAWERHAPPSQRGGMLSPPFPSTNVWLGTSVEDQQRADERIPALLDTPAAVRFLSCEPLLGPVDLKDHWLRPIRFPGPRVDWIIVGGESGPGARPMHPQWARDLRDQAVAAGVPFLFKQWGAWAPSRGRVNEQILMWPDGTHRPDTGEPRTPPGWTNLERVGKKVAGRELGGRTWDEFPEAVSADA